MHMLARQAAGRDGVASGSGGDAPTPGSPRGEGNKRARTITTTTTTSPGDTGRPPRPLITARHASRGAVVSSPELLKHVFAFLSGGKREARRDLGRAALVCRSWREAALGEELWGRVASELMPAMGRRVSEVGARRCVLERGHCFRDRRTWVEDAWWCFSLRLQVEVWDTLDETCLLSAEGRIGISDRGEFFHTIFLDGADRVEAVGPAFSAASRDPVQRRFASIDEYFRRPEGKVEDPISVRVFVRDGKTGRQALLWSASGQMKFQCHAVPPNDSLRPHLPEGSLIVTHEEHQPIYSPAVPGQAPRARVAFYVRPEAGQEGVGEADKMWRVAGGDEGNYGDNESFFNMEFNDDEARIASLIRGLLNT
jgi:hypothetical protein